ncbi:hypothetical protein POM88_005595 [Heracleum sosnowskyi]|uniref:Serpin domain-containing protein n=1 Tax=Heracleum sosnowskyi TaxID=360622 RepID=A0AAD8N4G6_9APIA|nr:hypothetical protein POM88_005595 [Heracleum sosnowskyi]
MHTWPVVSRLISRTRAVRSYEEFKAGLALHARLNHRLQGDGACCCCNCLLSWVLEVVQFRSRSLGLTLLPITTHSSHSWVEKETRGIIIVIFPRGSIKSSTKLVLANALYFKGALSHEFKASKTKYYDFHLLNEAAAATGVVMCFDVECREEVYMGAVQFIGQVLNPSIT